MVYNKKNWMAYYRRNHSKILARRREQYNLNIDYKRKQARENYKGYYLRHKEAILLRGKLYAKNNRDKINSYWRIKHKEQMQNNIQYAMRKRLRKVLRDAILKFRDEGKIMKSKKYPIDYKAIIIHLSPFPRDLDKYHIDHIKPLSKFDLTNKEDIRDAFSAENHQWLTINESLKKGDRYNG